MKLSKVVELINSKEKTVADLANETGVSQQFIKNAMTENSYVSDRKQGIKVYVGEGKPVDFDLLEAYVKRNSKKNSDDNKKKINKKPDKNQTKIREKEEETLNQDEIIFLKKMVRRHTLFDKDFELNYEFSRLPAKQPTKKASFEISKETYDEFDKFCKKVGDPRRMAKNDMIEMALIRFMKDFG